MLCWLWKKTDFMFFAVFWGCSPTYSPRCLLLFFWRISLWKKMKVIGCLTSNQPHIRVQILMSLLSAKFHPNLSQQPNSCQLQKLLLNSSQQLQQTRKLVFLAHCSLGTKNQNKLWSKQHKQLPVLKKTILDDSTGTVTLHIWDPHKSTENWHILGHKNTKCASHICLPI